MSFERNEYLGWYIPRIQRGDGAVNLHSSGVASLSVDAVQIPPYDPWTVVKAFEARLAQWLGIDEDALLFTPGATGGTLLSLLSLTSAGDEILVERPIYEPMLRQSERLAEVKRFGRSPETDWKLPVDEIVEMMRQRTSMVLMTEPANPSGTIAERDDVLAVADAAARNGALLLVNEVYLGYTDRPTLLGARDNILVVSSFSKLMGAYWMRLGWVAGPPRIVSRLSHAHANFSMATKPAAALGLGLLERANDLRKAARQKVTASQATVDDWVRSTKGISWTPPQGPGFGCVMLPPSVPDDVTFAETLHDEHGVLAVPGTHFEVPGSLRISWLQAGDRLVEGLETIAGVLADY